ncbi:DUF2794 domain-containing protein, partial [Paracoccus sp. APAP_BH8]|uniref:DUF2794 domain-containing protein n=1 Tax=Paracoccus sp. APAP_BH8 TaxID=3110237 RepID=UPI002FD7F037
MPGMPVEVYVQTGERSPMAYLAGATPVPCIRCNERVKFRDLLETAFDRAELGVILSLYGRMVAAGEWRDYAMSFLRDMAVFS